ncbi:hypothetical protein OIU74_003939 [Salix koriyanagi]|uniref:Uncharacterized protein n=1 Tax=Salix koriyanagi TaxID=2511006 RepID=A0A9Q0ZLU7_9ROSI|nr:hypothetical protein OIU74_003939 [Salix koriyanagi]
MASFCRSAMTATTRSLASRSKTVTQKTLNAKSMSSPFTPTTTRTILATSSFRECGVVDATSQCNCKC